MVVKQQLSKSIKNDITFEKKLHDEVPSGKNYKTSFFFMLSLSEFIILSLATPYRPFIANSNICCGLISKPISLCIGNINVDKGVEKDNPCVP
jgi:hypothetical protein